MIATEAVGRRDIRNNYPEEQVAGGHDVFALGEEILYASLKNRDETAHRRGHTLDACDEGLDDLRERVTVPIQRTLLARAHLIAFLSQKMCLLLDVNTRNLRRVQLQFWPFDQ